MSEGTARRAKRTESTTTESTTTTPEVNVPDNTPEFSDANAPTGQESAPEPTNPEPEVTEPAEETNGGPKLTFPEGHVLAGFIPLLSAAVSKAFTEYSAADAAVKYYRNGEAEVEKARANRLDDNSEDDQVKDILNTIEQLRAAIDKANAALEDRLDEISPLPEFSADKDEVNGKIDTAVNSFGNVTRLIDGSLGWLPTGSQTVETLLDYFPREIVHSYRLMTNSDNKLRKVGDKKPVIMGTAAGSGKGGSNAKRYRFSVMSVNGTDLTSPKAFGKRFAAVGDLIAHLKAQYDTEYTKSGIEEALKAALNVTDFDAVTDPRTIDLAGQKVTLQVMPKGN